MDDGNFVPLDFVAPLLVCLLLREIWWWKRFKNWVKSEGEVIGCAKKPADDGYVYCPVILYSFRGENREQICESNLCHYKVGKSVAILINPDSGKIFVATYQDRWFLSALLICCIAALLFLSYASHD
jgi:hypothetical protein